MKFQTVMPSLRDADSLCSTIRDAHGDEYFVRVLRAIGGLEFKVPRRKSSLTPDCPLVKALGYDDAAMLQAILPGEFLCLPKGYRENRTYDIVRRGVIAGQSNTEIAQENGFSVRWVRKVKQNLRELSAFPQTVVPAE